MPEHRHVLVGMCFLDSESSNGVLRLIREDSIALNDSTPCVLCAAPSIKWTKNGDCVMDRTVAWRASALNWWGGTRPRRPCWCLQGQGRSLFKGLLLLGGVEGLADVLPCELDLQHPLNLREDSVVRDSLALLVLCDDLRFDPNFLRRSVQCQCD